MMGHQTIVRGNLLKTSKLTADMRTGSVVETPILKRVGSNIVHSVKQPKKRRRIIHFIPKAFFIALLAGAAIMTSCKAPSPAASVMDGPSTPMKCTKNDKFMKDNTKEIRKFNSAACPGEHRKHQKIQKYKGK